MNITNTLHYLSPPIIPLWHSMIVLVILVVTTLVTTMEAGENKRDGKREHHDTIFRIKWENFVHPIII